MSTERKGQIHATAPARFDFCGAPTDVEPYRSQEGGYIVNGTLNIGAQVTIIPRNDRRILIHSENFNDQGEEYESVDNLRPIGPLRLIKAAVMHIAPTQGFELHTKVDVPPGSGLGASASLAVALLGALRTFVGETDLDPLELVKGALYVENVMLANISGEQDQYAAALGGFHGIEFRRDNVTVERIDIPDQMVKELEERSLFCHSGESHVSGQVLDNIMNAYILGKPATVDALRTLKELSYQIKQALTSGDVEEFGRIMKAVGQTQKKCHPDVISLQVEDIFTIAQQHGAIGGKIAGAGGAGFVYIFCEQGRKEEITDHLGKKGNLVLSVHFTADGVVVSSS